MTADPTVRRWQEAIIAECARRLARRPTEREQAFVRACGSFLALEMVEDTVKSLSGEPLETYLNGGPIPKP
ncbi:MAG: hypothetical protein M0025_04735 [Elusimicrobia bacterium]|nr:hypothetical protein [Elusimicrobiota bacterium]